MRRVVHAMVAALALVATAGIAGARTTPLVFPAVVAVRATPQEAVALSRFDLAEARFGDEIQVVLWRPDELRRLEELGFPWRLLPVDLAAEHASALPFAKAGDETRTTYRTYPEYATAMARLADDHPSLVRLIKMPELSLQGRNVLGVEIAAGDANDGRPRAYFDGVHHAREWPAGEIPMLFAEHLVRSYLDGVPRIVSLLEQTAVVVVPIVNPDGFQISRTAPTDGGGELSALVPGLPGAYWRKNARALVQVGGLALGTHGVDPNRNYAFQWGSGDLTGGFGASGFEFDETYQGAAPASEPEVRNVQGFLLACNCTAMISNHTYGRLVLYPWGHTADPPPDLAIFQELAESMAAATGYTPQPGIALYPTTGTTDDWAYAATGILGFTFEHGASFHPSYAAVATPWILNRNLEAFTQLVEAAADPALHSIVRGRIVDAAGRDLSATLVLRKRVEMPLWEDGDGSTPTGQRTVAQDVIVTLPVHGAFAWHVNPSIGPISADDYSLTVSSGGHIEVRSVRVDRGAEANLDTITLG